MTTTNQPWGPMPSWLVRLAGAAAFTGVLLVFCACDLAFSNGTADESRAARGTVQEESPGDVATPADAVPPPPGSQTLSCGDLDADFAADAKPEPQPVPEDLPVLTNEDEVDPDPTTHFDVENLEVPAPPAETDKNGTPRS